MNVSRGEIAQRCLLLRCPNCGESGLLRSWFRLHTACPHCGLEHGKEEGFTLGTTSIGYVVAFVLVVIPTCVAVVEGWMAVWVGVVFAITMSVALSVGLYPVFLGWVLMTYYVSTAEALPANRPEKKDAGGPHS